MHRRSQVPRPRPHPHSQKPPAQSGHPAPRRRLSATAPRPKSFRCADRRAPTHSRCPQRSHPQAPQPRPCPLSRIRKPRKRHLLPRRRRSASAAQYTARSPKSRCSQLPQTTFRLTKCLAAQARSFLLVVRRSIPARYSSQTSRRRATGRPFHRRPTHDIRNARRYTPRTGLR